jgi:hypothetical protein
MSESLRTTSMPPEARATMPFAPSGRSESGISPLPASKEGDRSLARRLFLNCMWVPPRFSHVDIPCEVNFKRVVFAPNLQGNFLSIFFGDLD